METNEGKFDVQLIKTFIEGTIDTMRVQCNIDAQVGKPYKVGEGKDHLKTLRLPVSSA